MANPITPSAANYAHEKMRVMTESGELYNIAELLEGLTASVSQVKDAVYYAPYTPTPTLGALTVELQAGVECLPTAAVDTLTLNFGATSAANPYWYIKFLCGAEGCTVSVPATAEYVGGTPPFAAGKRYVLAAELNGDGYAVKWDELP